MVFIWCASFEPPGQHICGVVSTLEVWKLKNFPFHLVQHLHLHFVCWILPTLSQYLCIVSLGILCCPLMILSNYSIQNLSLLSNRNRVVPCLAILTARAITFVQEFSQENRYSAIDRINPTDRSVSISRNGPVTSIMSIPTIMQNQSKSTSFFIDTRLSHEGLSGGSPGSPEFTGRCRLTSDVDFMFIPCSFPGEVMGQVRFLNWRAQFFVFVILLRRATDIWRK